MADRTLSNPKIKPIWNSVVTEVLDVKQDKVTGVRVKNLKTDTRSGAGLRRGLCGHWPCSRTLNSSRASSIWMKTATSSQARARKPISLAYSWPGDCSDNVYRQAVTAAGLGCAAAIDAERYLAKMNQ